MTRLRSGLLIAAAVLGASQRAPARTETERAVYAALLDSAYTDPTATRLLLARASMAPVLPRDGNLALDSVAAPADTLAVRAALISRGVPATLAADFATENARPRLLPDGIVATLPIDYDTLPELTDAQEDSLLRNARPEEMDGLGFALYARAYPGVRRRLAFSRVGLSPDRQQALVYVLSDCGSLCADGALITLRRIGAEWHAVRRDQLWVS